MKAFTFIHKKTAKTLGNTIIKVNHAGEHGAVCVYSGQIFLARLTAPSLVNELKAFRDDERKHRQIFADELKSRAEPRCKSYWLCALGGFILGFITALFGIKAIAATTVAVESVVLRHLAEQIQMLSGSDAQAVDAIQQIIDDEQAHHDHSLVHIDAGRFWTRLLMFIIDKATELVIFLGMRL